MCPRGIRVAEKSLVHWVIRLHMLIAVAMHATDRAAVLALLCYSIIIQRFSPGDDRGAVWLIAHRAQAVSFAQGSICCEAVQPGSFSPALLFLAVACAAGCWRPRAGPAASTATCRPLQLGDPRCWQSSADRRARPRRERAGGGGDPGPPVREAQARRGHREQDVGAGQRAPLVMARGSGLRRRVELSLLAPLVSQV
jgi:hypothetical protein